MQNNFSNIDDDKKKNVLVLSKNEENLIVKLRKDYRYGEIIIVMHDGVPQRLKKIEVFDDLHGSLA
jgi:hypothetical protein